MDYDWPLTFITTFPSAAKEGRVGGSEAKGGVMEGEEEGEREGRGNGREEVRRWQEERRERDKRRGEETREVEWRERENKRKNRMQCVETTQPLSKSTQDSVGPASPSH